MANFVNYDNAYTIMEAIAEKIADLNGAYVIKGSTLFAGLPATITSTMVGYVYNVTDDFETDARFLEGAGKKYAAGTNVVIVDNGTTTYSAVTPVGTENPSEEGWFELVGSDYVATSDTTVDSGKTYYEAITSEAYAFDVISTFVDVEALERKIKNVQDMITEEYDETATYETGDVIVKDGKLYEFSADFANYTEVTPEGTENPSALGWYEYVAGVPAGTYELSEDTSVDSSKTYYTKNSGDVEDSLTETTVVELINNAEPNPLTAEQIEALLALL